MKKKYSKPDIVYEDFTPSTSIAAGCTYEANADLYKCGVEYDIWTLFSSDLGDVCSLSVEDMSGQGKWDEVCYHNPSIGNNVFTSM